MTTDAFSASVKNWIKTAKHPKTGKLYKDMIYQPMLELLAYLRAHEYKTFIVSDGGMDFMRPRVPFNTIMNSKYIIKKDWRRVSLKW